MATYVILSQIQPGAFGEPKDFKMLAKDVSGTIKEQCPGINWKYSYATTGRFDVVDVVEADSPAEVEKAAMIIRSHGHAVTETMVATPWNEFLDAL